MLRNYLKIAWKVLARRKFYTFVSLFGVAFTLLILTMATALVDHLLAPVAPESRLDRMLSIDYAKLSGPGISSTGSPGYALLDRYGRDLPFVERMSIASEPASALSYVDGIKIVTQLRRTDAEYWGILDFEFAEGGPYGEQDVETGRRVVVINQTTRRRFFGGEPALGRSIQLDGQRFEVVGVVPDVAPIRSMAFAEAWAPITTVPSTSYRTQLRGGFQGILLVDDRSDFPEVKAELARRMATAQISDTRFDTMQSAALTMPERIALALLGDEPVGHPPLGRLYALVGLLVLLFMLLPAVNLVNLNLSRILERSSEIGVRKAFGASSLTLIGQFLVESVVLTTIGGCIGFALAELCLLLLNRSELIPYGDFGVNLRVFAVGMLLSVVFGIVSGVYPAWRMSRMHPVASIQGRPS